MYRNIFVLIVTFVFTYLILNHLIKQFMEPFSSNKKKNDVDMNENIQIDKDKLEEASANYFGMKQARLTTNTKMPNIDDSVESSFT